MRKTSYYIVRWYRPADKQKCTAIISVAEDEDPETRGRDYVERHLDNQNGSLVYQYTDAYPA